MSSSSSTNGDIEKSSAVEHVVPKDNTIVDVDDNDRAVKRALWKVDLTVLPLLFLGLLVFQLDRMNIASALTGGFAKDIGVSQSDINAGNQLMFAGIVILEIPFNMALQRVGPRIFLSLQVFVFGLIATMQVLVRTRKEFLAVRAILGLAEAGYIPGGCFTLSSWFSNTQLAKRVAIFFFGMFAGNALSPLLASGILKLDGRHGLRGWQYIFLIEGLFTIGVSFLLLLFLPGSIATPRPLLTKGIVRITPADAEILASRLVKENGGKTATAAPPSIPLKKVWATITHYQRWLHFVSTFAVFSTWSPLTTYTPSIIKSLGFGTIEANALAAVGAFLALVMVFIFAMISDRTNKRGATVILAQLCYLVVLICARQIHPHVGKWSRWGLWTAVNALAVGYHPVHNTWVQLNCRDPGERSIAIAMWVMSAISGLMVGTQYYRADDTKSFYQTGLRTQIIMVSIGIAAAIGQLAVYLVHNRRVAAVRGVEDGEMSERLYVP